MSRASLKELQSLALFGWDRQHDHAPNGELLNMPSHAEQTKFYQSGRQRRRRSCSTGHAQRGACAQSQTSKSKPRCPPAGDSKAQRASASQGADPGELRNSCVAPSTGEPAQGLGMEQQLSPVKPPIGVTCAAQVTPRVVDKRHKRQIQGDRASRLSVAGIPSTHRHSACTPSLQWSERSAFGGSVTKQNAAARCAGHAEGHTHTCRLDDTSQSASLPPSRSPLHSEYTRFVQSLPGHSSAYRASEAVLPNSPSAGCAPESLTSLPSLTHDQENKPPSQPTSPKLQPCQDVVVCDAGPGSCKPRAALQASPAATIDPPGPALQSHLHTDHDRPSLMNDDIQDAPESSAFEPYSTQCTDAEQPVNEGSLGTAGMAAPSQNKAKKAPSHLHGDGAATTLNRSDRELNQLPALQPQEPAQSDGAAITHSVQSPPAAIAEGAAAHSMQIPPAAIAEGAAAHSMRSPPAAIAEGAAAHSMQIPPAAIAEQVVAAASACAQRETIQKPPAGHGLAPDVAAAGVHELCTSNTAGPRPQPVQHQDRSGTGLPPGLTGACLHQAERGQAAVTVANGGTSTCADLQGQRDRHAMPPPKPKRVCVQPSLMEGEEQEKSRPTSAVGFWQKEWTSGEEVPELPLFKQSCHIPLFHPSASLPSGNAWILTFLP
eukprot:jgi/Ulvmu1/2200/UM013_0046.1